MADDHYREQLDFFERLARRYDSRFLRARWPRNQRLKARTVQAELGPALEGRILDVGCGTAQVAAELLAASPSTSYVGVDLSQAMLDVARVRLRPFADRIELRAVPDGRLAFEPSSFDGAFGIDVLHHVDDPVEVLARLRDAVRPGGRVVFLEPNPRFPVTAALGIFEREERNVLKIGFRNLRAWFERAGLGRVDVRYGPLYTPPGPDAIEPFLDRVDGVVGQIPLVRSLAIFFTASGVVEP